MDSSFFLGHSVYSALEKKKRTDFNAIKNNPEIKKHN
jgi:hypothetical protein